MDQQERPPLPPFDEASAREKVQKAEDAWNTRNPEKVALAYTEDSKWRNRDQFFEGREAIIAFLGRKWERELDYRLKKELWCYQGNRISVRFEYESRDRDGQWWRLGCRWGPRVRGRRAGQRGRPRQGWQRDGQRGRPRQGWHRDGQRGGLRAWWHRDGQRG